MAVFLLLYFASSLAMFLNVICLCTLYSQQKHRATNWLNLLWPRSWGAAHGPLGDRGTMGNSLELLHRGRAQRQRSSSS
jgi:hypothetical protein